MTAEILRTVLWHVIGPGQTAAVETLAAERSAGWQIYRGTQVKRCFSREGRFRQDTEE